MAFTLRPATSDDLPVLRPLITAAIDELQRDHLDPGQISASHAIMGVDTQLIDDGTYFVVEADGQLAGCGGWSRRATHYGGDHSPGRDDALLDPSTDAARIRAMYTSPRFAGQGVGRRILARCEQAAAAEGFGHLELVATLAGQPLYTSAGFQAIRRFNDTSTGTEIPLIAMRKAIDAQVERCATPSAPQP